VIEFGRLTSQGDWGGHRGASSETGIEPVFLFSDPQRTSCHNFISEFIPYVAEAGGLINSSYVEV